MYYLILDIGQLIIHVSKTEPIRTIHEDMPVIKLADGGFIRDVGDYEIAKADFVPLGEIKFKYCYVDGRYIYSPSFPNISVSQYENLLYTIDTLQNSYKNLFMEQVVTELELEERICYVELGIPLKDMEGNNMKTYDNCVEIIHAKKKTREELLKAMDVFLLNERLLPNEYLDLVALMDSTGLVAQEPPHEPPTEEIPLTPLEPSTPVEDTETSEPIE